MIAKFFFSLQTTMSQTISDVANDIGNGFGKTSKFISFLYSAYQERERERERRERRAFIFKDRFFVKEIFSLARGVCLLFFR